MNKICIAFFILICLVGIASCEKDDICVDGDTPLLVIGFFDVDDTTEAKNVTALRIRAIGQEDDVDTFTNPSSQDSVGIPLRISETSTAYLIVSDSGTDDEGNETGNIDTLTFSYDVIEDFVSRACGFVANYDNLSFDLQPDTDNWIQNVVIVDTTIENSTAIHVKIFH
ncbi:DUF6452 family protein [Allomuricauda sp. SCSIO 65647]|uniref:DUF6452 family protein n=1 Tax=Allomuricauda sp. SCSIO 65647 TaxID=2908843 RepID=UPI001F3F21CC|nr:DUF6452 family protein [Muricauda sp. SCSIO 65647]UJH67950.1 DUF6452 family protein [Muricauda sp. SCSIO 65647]